MSPSCSFSLSPVSFALLKLVAIDRGNLCDPIRNDFDFFQTLLASPELLLSFRSFVVANRLPTKDDVIEFATLIMPLPHCAPAGRDNFVLPVCRRHLMAFRKLFVEQK